VGGTKREGRWEQRSAGGSAPGQRNVENLKDVEILRRNRPILRVPMSGQDRFFDILLDVGPSLIFRGGNIFEDTLVAFLPYIPKGESWEVAVQARLMIGLLKAEVLQ
jgi:hypothetical protein